HVYPIGGVILHAAVPSLPEAEDVFVESICGRPVFDDNPDVNDALRNAALRQELPEITAVQRARSELDELHDMPVRICDLKSPIAILHGFQLPGYFHAVAGQVSAQLLYVR